MHQRPCLVKAPVWNDLFAYADYEEDDVSDRWRKRTVTSRRTRRLQPDAPTT